MDTKKINLFIQIAIAVGGSGKSCAAAGFMIYSRQGGTPLNETGGHAVN